MSEGKIMKEKINQEEDDVKKVEDEIKLKYEEAKKQILSREIEVLVEDNIETKKIGDLIDHKLHFWMSKDTYKPIINEDGFRILTKCTGVEFGKPNIVEKQSDFRNMNGQVWIEIEAKFPNGEVNTEYGIANQRNSPGHIGMANLPIMALKRAKERAFYRSKTVNLFVYSDNEMAESFTNEIRELRKELEEQIARNNNAIKEYKKLKSEVEESRKNAKSLLRAAIESSFVDEKRVWDITDVNLLQSIINGEKGAPVDRYVAEFKLQMLNKLKKNK